MPRFKELIERWGRHALNMWLGMYGAPTWKMVKLFSSDPFIYRLFRTELCSCFQMFSNSFQQHACMKTEYIIHGSGVHERPKCSILFGGHTLLCLQEVGQISIPEVPLYCPLHRWQRAKEV